MEGIFFKNSICSIPPPPPLFLPLPPFDEDKEELKEKED